MNTTTHIVATCIYASIIAFSISPALAKEKQHIRPVESWEIEDVSDDGNDDTDFCLARTYYNNGIIFIIARDKYAEQRLALNFPDNRLSAGDTYPISLNIDTGWKLQTTATAASRNMLVVTFDNDTDFLKTIGQGYTFTMESNNDGVEFDLSGIGKALEKLDYCIRKELPTPPLAKQVSTAMDTPTAHAKKTLKTNDETAPQTPSVNNTGKSLALPIHIQSTLAISGYIAQNPTQPSNRRIPLDLVWGKNGVLSGYKQLTLPKPLLFTDTVKQFISTLRPICDGPFIAEASPIYTINDHNFMHAEIGCSTDKRDSIAALLFYQSTPTQIDALYFEGKSENGADVITMRNKVSHALETRAKQK